MHSKGMIRYRRAFQDRGVLGIFFVAKKDGRIRIIFDTRILNTKFRDPPSTRLPSAAAISSLEVPSHSELYVATGDLANAFYCFSVPDDISDMFSMPSI